MPRFSPVYTERSNARRAAKARGYDPETVKECEGGFHFATPNDASDLPEFLDRSIPENEKKAREARKNFKPSSIKQDTQPRLKLSGGKAKRGKVQLPKGVNNRDAIRVMITGPRGATMPELVKATRLKEHTLRARISEIADEHKLEVTRERLLGITTYKAKPKSRAA